MGNGTPDLVIVENEYPDGRLSWFENRLGENSDVPWFEHEMDRPIYYGHSLSAWRDATTQNPTIMVAEMRKGGWEEAWKRDSRVMLYQTADGGATWRAEVCDRGFGTHNAVACDIDGDGAIEVVGKPCFHEVLQLWKKTERARPVFDYGHRFVDRRKEYTGSDLFAVDIDGDGIDDLVCAGWWYRAPDWERRKIPGIAQAITAYDIDGDGEMEIIVGEHNPFHKERSGARLLVYRKAESTGLAWTRHEIDNRFDHHDGARVVRLANGKLGIASHGWTEEPWLHLWEPQ